MTHDHFSCMIRPSSPRRTRLPDMGSPDGLRRRIVDAKVGHDSHLRADHGRISFPINPDKQTISETAGTLQKVPRAEIGPPHSITSSARVTGVTGMIKLLVQVPTTTAVFYQRLIIHFAPTTISQIATVATVSTTAAASNAIKSSTPSSSR
jgi:hypothetical protein